MAQVIHTIISIYTLARIYFGHMKNLVKESRNKWYLTISAIIFAVIAIAHLAMIALQMQGSIGSYQIPFELNGVVVITMGYLAARGFMVAHKL